jgi:hypothetical protein
MDAQAFFTMTSFRLFSPSNIKIQRADQQILSGRIQFYRR